MKSHPSMTRHALWSLFLIFILSSLAFASESSVDLETEYFFVRPAGDIYRITTNPSGEYIPERIWSWNPESESTPLTGGKGALLISIQDSMRTTLRPRESGHWDMIEQEFEERRRKGLFSAVMQQLDPKIVREKVVHKSVLLPLRDERMIDLVMEMKQDTRGKEDILNELIEDHPVDPVLACLAIDDAILSNEDDRFSLYLQMWEPLLQIHEESIFSDALLYYLNLINMRELSRQNNNVLPELMKLRNWEDEFDAASPEEWREMLKHITYHNVVVPVWGGPFLIYKERRGDTPNFLELQVRVKHSRAHADFLLMQGYKEEALEEYLGMHRLGTIMTGRSALIVSALIGAAMNHITVEGLNHVYLSAIEDEDELAESWAVLDNAYSAQRAVTFYQPYIEAYEIVRYGPDYNQLDVETRMVTSFVRMACLHSAVAAKHTYLDRGIYPLDDGPFSILLPQPDPDPYSEYNEPLRYRTDKEKGFIVYSIGPDLEDNEGKISYDPTNGTLSPGDLITAVPRTREFPFPEKGKLPETRNGILRLFAHGLPRDPFNHAKASYIVTDEDPARIFSIGPASNFDALSLEDREDTDVIPPKGFAVATRGENYLTLRNESNKPSYDPTNGILSTGNFFMSRE